jgi:hypothetical protein
VKKVIVTPLGDQLRFAGTMEFAGMDLRMNDARAEATLRAGRQILQPLDEPLTIERWCGLRPCTPDGIPIVDRIPGHPNVYIAAGHVHARLHYGSDYLQTGQRNNSWQTTFFAMEPLRLSRFSSWPG